LRYGLMQEKEISPVFSMPIHETPYCTKGVQLSRVVISVPA
jgi:hypothetical protein